MCLAFAVFGTAQLHGLVAGDTFITYQYPLNLATGHGWINEVGSVSRSASRSTLYAIIPALAHLALFPRVGCFEWVTLAGLERYLAEFVSSDLAESAAIRPIQATARAQRPWPASPQFEAISLRNPGLVHPVMVLNVSLFFSFAVAATAFLYFKAFAALHQTTPGLVAAALVVPPLCAQVYTEVRSWRTLTVFTRAL